MMARSLALLLALAPIARAEVSLPLPPAPVRVVIPDAAAFDAALAGSYRRALLGSPGEDPLAAAWRRTPVGTKLEAQWARLGGDLPWTWEEIQKLKPRALGLALLSVGSLEAVLVVDTPLVALPVVPPPGEARTHGGASYRLVARGAGDASPDPDRRLGLAWAQHGGHLFLATSERALLLALDEALTGRGVGAFASGLVSLELDLDALRQDRYFRREFLFGEGSGPGRVVAALHAEGGRLVEVREGRGETRGTAMAFDVPRAAAAAWEPEGASLWPALRAALLEPIPILQDRPAPPPAELPLVARASGDRYLVSLEQPPPGPAQWEEGDLALWRGLLARQPPDGWGYALSADGVRRVVFAWPAARQSELEALCRATVERRCGRASVVAAGDAREVRVGPGLAVLALKRTGDFVWIGPTARDLADATAPRPAPDLVRWARLDLRAVRAEGARWARLEGPPSPERIRPFSDRILGLLGWMPATTSLTVERRRTATGWTERVVLATDQP